MANSAYTHGIDSLLTGGVDIDTDTIKAVLVKNDYTFSASDQFLSSISSGSRLATVTVTSVSVTAGVVDATDVSFASVSGSGTPTANAVVLYKDTGSSSTSNLLFYLDTASSGLPVNPNGGDVNVAWSNGSNKIVKVG